MDGNNWFFVAFMLSLVAFYLWLAKKALDIGVDFGAELYRWQPTTGWGAVLKGLFTSRSSVAGSLVVGATRIAGVIILLLFPVRQCLSSPDCFLLWALFLPFNMGVLQGLVKGSMDAYHAQMDQDAAESEKSS